MFCLACSYIRCLAKKIIIHHMDLTKQIGESLPLEKYFSDEYVSVTSQSTRTDAARRSSILDNCEKMLLFFRIVKLLVCIKVTKQPGILLKLDKELSKELKPGRIVVSHPLGGRNVVRKKSPQKTWRIEIGDCSSVWLNRIRENTQ